MRERKQGIYADFQHSIKVVFERIGPHQPPQDISLLGISIWLAVNEWMIWNQDEFHDWTPSEIERGKKAIIFV